MCPPCAPSCLRLHSTFGRDYVQHICSLSRPNSIRGVTCLQLRNPPTYPLDIFPSCGHGHNNWNGTKSHGSNRTRMKKTKTQALCRRGRLLPKPVLLRGHAAAARRTPGLPARWGHAHAISPRCPGLGAPEPPADGPNFDHRAQPLLHGPGAAA